MIDLHSHILPGVDDGPATLAESLDIARAAVEDGIEAVAATPHVRDDYPTSPEAMEQGVAELREALAAEGIPLSLHTGGEIALDRVERTELERFALGGGQYVLLEFPYYGWPLGLHDAVFRLGVSGLRAVLAHPERNAEVQAAPERLEPVVASGALVQVTAASLDGRLGGSSQRCALDLIARGLAHLIASDAHAPALRGIGMSIAAKAVANEELARRLTYEVPADILGYPPP